MPSPENPRRDRSAVFPSDRGSTCCWAIPERRVQKLGWRHKTSFADLVKEMVEGDRSEVRLEGNAPTGMIEVRCRAMSKAAS